MAPESVPATEGLAIQIQLRVFSAITLGGGNIFLGHFDPFAGSSTDTNAVNVLFGLVDNVNVTPVPEPATYAAVFGLLAGAIALIRRRAS